MTVSEPRIPTTPHVHECGIEGGTHRLCFCVVCNESYRNKKFVPRAEPSRGASDAALQALRVWEVDTDAWPTAREGNAFIDGFQAGRAGHVVLLEALRRLTDVGNKLRHGHSKDVTTAETRAFMDALERAEAAIQQAERT